MTKDLENGMILLAAVRVFHAVGPFLIGNCSKISDETIAFIEARLIALEMELSDDVNDATRERMGSADESDIMPDELAQLLHAMQHAQNNARNGAETMERMIYAIIAQMN